MTINGKTDRCLMKTKIHPNRVVKLDPRMLEDLGIKLGDKVDLYLRDTDSIFLVKYGTRRQEWGEPAATVTVFEYPGGK